MQQPELDLSEPVDPLAVSPVGQPRLPPVNGKTPQSRHSSYTGAVRAAEKRSLNIERLRALWVEPFTMDQIAHITCLPLSSICSLKSCIEDELEIVDMVPQTWPTGRTTKRCRWQLRACAQRPTR